MKFFDITKEIDKDVLEKFNKAFDSPIKLQIFKTPFYDEDVEKAKKQHEKEILTSIIYSKYGEATPVAYNEPLYFMSGFIEQKNRNPNINDNIKIIKGKRYFDVFLCPPHSFIISEIGFQII